MIASLTKTLQKTTHNIAALLSSKNNKYTKEQIEEILIECDVEYGIVESVLDNIPSYVSREALEKELLALLELNSESAQDLEKTKPLVTLDRKSVV